MCARSAIGAPSAPPRLADKTDRNPTSRPLAPAPRLACSANLEIFNFTAGFYSSDQPARLFPPAGPCFGRMRIAIFWKDPRVFASCLAISAVRSRSIPLNGVPATVENCQTLFKLTLFRRDPCGQNFADLSMERPEVIDRHRYQI